MANSSWINKIIYKQDAEDTNGNPFPIGTTFDKVYDSEEQNFSLRQFIDLLKKFFNRQGFMLYSNTEPTINSRTMEWYALYYENSDDIDSTFDLTDSNEEVYE